MELSSKSCGVNPASRSRVSIFNGKSEKTDAIPKGCRAAVCVAGFHLITLTLQADATTVAALSEARQNISKPWPYLEDTEGGEIKWIMTGFNIMDRRGTTTTTERQFTVEE